MTRKWMMYPFLLLALAAFLVVGCSDDDDDGISPVDNSDHFILTISNVSEAGTFSTSGVFNTPMGANDPGPIGPGNNYQFSFGAAPGQVLQFATMMVQSNDLFVAPPIDEGLALFDNDDNPRSGDVTSELVLLDAGTEANEEPGVGENQAPRQSGADTGPDDPNSEVRLVNDQYDYPAVDEMLQVTLAHDGGNEFTVTIENVSFEGTIHTSTGEDIAVPYAPGVYAVTSDPAGFYEDGNGLEALAEDGMPGDMAGWAAMNTSIAVPLAPGVFVVHGTAMPIFSSGGIASPGLEALAEDGDPSILFGELEEGTYRNVGVFNTPVNAMDPAPIFPGESYRFEFDAAPGEKLSFATMFVKSNDLFYATQPGGFSVFGQQNMPVSGDITGSIQLWDAGTEMNEYPGAGPNQAPLQAGPDTGPDDPDNTVRPENDEYMYPDNAQVIQVMLEVE